MVDVLVGHRKIARVIGRFRPFENERTRSAVQELGEQFLPIMRHELQGRFAENQPFLGEREKQRATILLLEARGQRRSAPDSHSIK